MPRLFRCWNWCSPLNRSTAYARAPAEVSLGNRNSSMLRWLPMQCFAGARMLCLAEVVGSYRGQIIKAPTHRRLCQGFIVWEEGYIKVRLFSIGEVLSQSTRMSVNFRYSERPRWGWGIYERRKLSLRGNSVTGTCHSGNFSKPEIFWLRTLWWGFVIEKSAFSPKFSFWKMIRINFYTLIFNQNVSFFRFSFFFCVWRNTF